MSQEPSLANLNPGETAVIKELRATGGMRRRFLDIGLIENTPVECLGRSPAGDPTAYLIRGAVIAIRAEDSAGILITSEEGGVAHGAYSQCCGTKRS